MRKNVPDVPNIRFPGFLEAWNRKKVGETITEIIRPIEMIDNQKYQLVTVKRRNEGVVSRGYYYGREILVKNYKELHAGDYLISKRQIVHGANGLVPKSLDKAIVSNEYMICTSNEISMEFLALLSMTKKMKRDFFLCSYGVDIEKMVFDVEDWKKCELIFPTMEEQQKILDFFSSIDKIIAASEEEVANLETQKKAVMKKIFSQEVRFKKADGSDFPEWAEYRIGDICKTYSGGTPKAGNDDYYGGSIPFIRSGEIHSDSTELFLSEEGLKKSSAKMVAVGDIIMALYGATSGEIDISKIEGAINQAILCIKPEDGFDRKFVVEVFRNNKDDILKTYLQGGQGNLSAQIVQGLSFEFPCLEEQRLIADFLSDFDEAIAAAKKELELWKELKKGLLQQMFV